MEQKKERGLSVKSKASYWFYRMDGNLVNGYNKYMRERKALGRGDQFLKCCLFGCSSCVRRG